MTENNGNEELNNINLENPNTLSGTNRIILNSTIQSKISKILYYVGQVIDETETLLEKESIRPLPLQTESSKDPPNYLINNNHHENDLLTKYKEKLPLHVKEQIILLKSEIERLKVEATHSQQLQANKSKLLEEQEIFKLKLQDNLNTKELEMEILKKQNERFSHEQQEFEKVNNVVQSQVKSLEKKILEFSNNLTTLKKKQLQLTAINNSYEDKLKKAEKIIETRSEQLQRKREAICQLQSEKEDLKQQNVQLTQKLQLKISIQQLNFQKEENLRMLDREKSLRFQVEEMFQISEKKNWNLQEQLKQSFDEKMQKYFEKETKLNETIFNLQKELEEESKKDEELKKKNFELQEEIFQIQNELEAEKKNNQVKRIHDPAFQLQQVQEEEFEVVNITSPSKEIMEYHPLSPSSSPIPNQTSMIINIKTRNPSVGNNNPNYCQVCGKPGFGLMISCIQCKKRFHVECLASKQVQNSKGGMICSECKSGSNANSLTPKKKLKKN